VNLVLIAEGEEEIGSVHIRQLARAPKVQAALAKTVGVFMPSASQGLDGVVTVSLGAKGVVELELVASGEKWGRGPAKDVHSSLKAMVDSPPGDWSRRSTRSCPRTATRSPSTAIRRRRRCSPSTRR
jgi:hypothetical protein